MAKYYVQCGSIRQIRSADCQQQAAVSLVDEALQAHLWIYDDPTISDDDCRDHLMMEALLHLDSVIRVSEKGFDRVDAELVGTPETIQHWHALMVAVAKLLVEAGLRSRSVSSVATTETTSAQIPRLPR